jgi:small neutral amino acid transporter SnatA (MarC family)
MFPGSGLNASFAAHRPANGQLALISQSGAIAAAMVEWGAQRKIGFSGIVSIGDQLDVDTADLLDHDVAAFPLAIPLIAGPGAITATLLLAGRAVNELWALAVLIGIIAAVGCACAIAFLLAEKVARALGATGNIVLARLLGVLLAALAVQFVIDGLRTAFG